jgi:hypothetical protein
MGADVRLIGSLMVRHTVYIIKCLFCFLLFFWRRLLATVRGFCVQFGSAFSFATDKMFQPPPPLPTRAAATDIATSNRQVNGRRSCENQSQSQKMRKESKKQ